MPAPAMTETVRAILAKVAPNPGDTFHFKDLLAEVDGFPLVKLHSALRRLQGLGLIRWTGRIAVWERVA